MKSLLKVREPLSPKTDFFVGFGAILLLVALWCFLTYGGHIRTIFLPSPTDIYEGAASFMKNGWLGPAIIKSSVRVFLALVLVVAIGVPVGVLMGSFPVVDAALRKIINGGKSVPTTGLVGLIVLWFSIEERAKIVFLFLGAIFYLIILVRQAVASVNDEYVRVALDIGCTNMQLVRKVLLPAALPRIWEAIAVCNGIMWTYIVLAEFINNSEEQIGLGYLLYVGSRTQDSGKVFLTLFLVGAISATVDFVFASIRKKWLFW